MNFTQQVLKWQVEGCFLWVFFLQDANELLPYFAKSVTHEKAQTLQVMQFYSGIAQWPLTSV